MKVLAQLLFIVSCLLTACNSQFTTINHLQDCDLLFHVAEADNAITAVTHAISGAMIDHVGIFYTINNTHETQNKFIIEAIDDGVVISSIDSFIQRKGAILVGRVRNKIDRKQTISNALSYVGRAYDFLYLPDNSDIYCSELVLLSFIDKAGKTIFSPIPMTFRNNNGLIPEYWQDLYSHHNMQVPEGVSGSNPGELSKRKNIKIKQLKY